MGGLPRSKKDKGAERLRQPHNERGRRFKSDEHPHDDHLEGLKKGDVVELKSGGVTGHTGAQGWFHRIISDGRYDIELGLNLGYSHRHIYVEKSQIRRLSES